MPTHILRTTSSLLSVCPEHSRDQRAGQPPILDRFWSKVDKTGDCWEWTAGLSQKGYGHFTFSGRTFRAHRISYELAYGPIPPGLQICHHCDNPKCVRPDHLYAGTNGDNVRDAYARGLNNGRRKLTFDQAQEVRAMYATGRFLQRELAQIYGIHRAGISLIILGRSYR